MKKIVILIKIIVLGTIVFMYNMMMQSVSPIIENQLAMNQMTNTVDSSMGIQMYTYAKNYGWVGFLILVLALFLDEIISLINRMKENKSKDEEN